MDTRGQAAAHYRGLYLEEQKKVLALSYEHKIMLEALHKIAAAEDDPYILGPVNDIALEAIRSVSGKQSG